MKSLILLLVFISAIAASFGALFLKKGSKQFNLRVSRKFIYEILKNYSLLFGIGMYVLGTVFFIWALRLGELSMVYPLTSMTYILVCILSVYFLKEKMNMYKWIGIGFILTGVILVTI